MAKVQPKETFKIDGPESAQKAASYFKNISVARAETTLKIQLKNKEVFGCCFDLGTFLSIENPDGIYFNERRVGDKKLSFVPFAEIKEIMVF